MARGEKAQPKPEIGTLGGCGWMLLGVPVALAALVIALFLLLRGRVAPEREHEIASASPPVVTIAPAPSHAPDPGRLPPHLIDPSPEPITTAPQAPPSEPAPPPVHASDPVNGSGKLNINSVPPSKVTLDGKPIGSTPLLGVNVPAGPHEVVFEHPELGKKTVQVNVPPNEVRLALVRFTPAH